MSGTISRLHPQGGPPPCQDRCTARRPAPAACRPRCCPPAAHPSSPLPGCLPLLGPYACAQTGVLGEGSFGRVLKALDLRAPAAPAEVAIKLLPRGDFVKNYRTYVKREIVHQSSLKHPLIVNLKEVGGVEGVHGWVGGWVHHAGAGG